MHMMAVNGHTWWQSMDAHDGSQWMHMMAVNGCTWWQSMDVHDGSQCVIHGMPTYVFNKWMVKKILVWQGVNCKILHLVLCF
jgi:hypothetical protein